MLDFGRDDATVLDPSDAAALAPGGGVASAAADAEGRTDFSKTVGVYVGVREIHMRDGEVTLRP